MSLEAPSAMRPLQCRDPYPPQLARQSHHWRRSEGWAVSAISAVQSPSPPAANRRCRASVELWLCNSRIRGYDATIIIASSCMITRLNRSVIRDRDDGRRVRSSSGMFLLLAHASVAASLVGRSWFPAAGDRAICVSRVARRAGVVEWDARVRRARSPAFGAVGLPSVGPPARHLAWCGKSSGWGELWPSSGGGRGSGGSRIAVKRAAGWRVPRAMGIVI